MDKSFVIDKLAQKKKLDPNCIAFGVERHRYELLPPIEESNLVKLEIKYGISLPEDYRKFLIEIGNGGAGPSYGLYSIQGSLTGKPDNTYLYPSSGAGEEIKRPFIRPDKIDENDEEFPDDYGMMILCQHGCANDDFLIINGSERGYVWEYIEWIGHHIPLLKRMPELSYINNLPKEKRKEAEYKWVESILAAGDDEKMTFSDWYIDWLNKPPHILPGAGEKKEKIESDSWL